MLFTSNFGMTGPGDIISVNGQDAALQNHMLPIEHSVFSLREATQFSMIIVRLPNNLPTGDLNVSVTLRGSTSNTAKISISP
jgi:hypothetical protein